MWSHISVIVPIVDRWCERCCVGQARWRADTVDAVDLRLVHPVEKLPDIRQNVST